MSAVLIIASNTFKEIIRDRILYGLLIFAFLLIGLSLALGQLTFAEQSRITINFGFTAIHLSSAILSIFVGSTLVAREIDKKTILTLLARPVSRTQFLIGKFFGLLAVIFVTISLLALVLIVLLLAKDLEITGKFFVGLYGVLLEAGLLLAVTIFFGTFSSSILAVAFSLAVFILGHWVDSLKYFATNSQSSEFQFVAILIQNIVPNLENLNWRSLFVYQDAIPYHDIGFSSLYAFAWILFAMVSAAIVLRRRDLG